jgi:hypothetical protein
MSNFSEGLALQINMLARVEPHDNTRGDYACNTLAIFFSEMLFTPHVGLNLAKGDFLAK